MDTGYGSLKLRCKRVIASGASDLSFLCKLRIGCAAKRTSFRIGKCLATSEFGGKQASENRIEYAEIVIPEEGRRTERNFTLLFKLFGALLTERIAFFFSVYVLAVKYRSFILFAFFTQHNYQFLSFYYFNLKV